MKFALVAGQRQEAAPGLAGECPACNRPLVAKCGEVRIRHWAHLGSRVCDQWWENEGEWHRAWKAHFPESWQEVVHSDANGEKHIADIKTERGWAIEFQHSFLRPEERRSRDGFYGRIIWVVDGTRRKRDSGQFENAWRDGSQITPIVRRMRSDECALLREWVSSPMPVFFDFGHPQALWWLLPVRLEGIAYIAMFPRAAFIGSHAPGSEKGGHGFDELVRDLGGLVAHYEAQLLRAPAQPQVFVRAPRRRFRF